MRGRRRKAPTTQLARGGERTRLLIGDSPIEAVRFKATVLNGQVEGRIDIETIDGLETHPLTDDNRLPVNGLISLSVVPQRDTAITFLMAEQPKFGPVVVLGALFLLGALGLTAWDFMGL